MIYVTEERENGAPGKGGKCQVTPSHVPPSPFAQRPVFHRLTTGWSLDSAPPQTYVMLRAYVYHIGIMFPHSRGGYR